MARVSQRDVGEQIRQNGGGDFLDAVYTVSRNEITIVTAQCANCDRKTPFLFDGFALPKGARGKFIVGESIRLSAKGRRARFGRKRGKSIFAFLIGFCRDEEMVRIRWEGNEQAEYFHMDFWEPVEKRNNKLVEGLSMAFLSEPAQVCQRCRPPSNLEIQEMLEASRGNKSRTRRSKVTNQVLRRAR